MKYFPIFLEITDKPVLVVGGGEVACRKIDALLRAGALVTIVSPTNEPYLAELVAEQKCSWVQNFYCSELMTQEYIQVWATTNNPDLNHQVYQDAKAMRLLANVVDDQPCCDFITPSMIQRGRVQIAISSGGASPVLVRNIREKLEAALPHNISLLADFGASKRNSIKQNFTHINARREFWQLFFSNPKVQATQERSELERLYQQALQRPLLQQFNCTWIEFSDDVELLSLKALRLMQQAELVLYPKACPMSFIDLIRRDAERLCFHSTSELSLLLSNAEQEKKQVCVFIPQQKSKYTFLIGQNLVLTQAQQR